MHGFILEKILVRNKTNKKASKIIYFLHCKSLKTYDSMFQDSKTFFKMSFEKSLELRSEFQNLFKFEIISIK